MAHDASNNNPKKEVLQALIGIALLLTIIAGIAISAWLRPAGNHEPATVSATKAGQALDELYQKQAAPASASAEATATAAAPAASTSAVATATAASSTAEASKAAQPSGDKKAVQDKAAADGAASTAQPAADAKAGK